MNALTEQVLDFARSWGAALVGVATRETLAGGPPSADLEYVLPGARSAVSIAVGVVAIAQTVALACKYF